MRRAALLLAALLAACGEEAEPDRIDVPGRPGASKTVATARAERRAYDGAPPVIPHDPFGGHCTTCHDAKGVAVPDVGFAPPSPHELTAGLSAMSHCQQCHVYSQTDERFVANSFDGLPQDLRPGPRAYDGAPPRLPHPVFMRENCRACHTGPAAREELRCSHPERANCRQCHVPVRTVALFER